VSPNIQAHGVSVPGAPDPAHSVSPAAPDCWTPWRASHRTINPIQRLCKGPWPTVATATTAIARAGSRLKIAEGNECGADVARVPAETAIGLNVYAVDIMGAAKTLDLYANPSGQSEEVDDRGFSAKWWPQPGYIDVASARGGLRH
jgi:hypothetical protein